MRERYHLVVILALLIGGPAIATSKQAEILNNRGADLFNKNDYDGAIAAFDAAIRADPGYAKAYANRGGIYALKSDYERALRDLDEAIRLNPKDESALANRAVVHSQKGDDSSALADLDQVSRLNPKNVSAYLNRGAIYLSHREYDRAIAELDRALRIAPKHVEGLTNRAVAYYESKQTARAFADFEAAVKAAPASDLPHRVRGDYYREAGKLCLARADLDQAVKLNPRRALNVSTRGDVLGESGDLDRAIADYDNAIRLDPDSPFGYQGRGVVYRVRGDLRPSIDAFSEVIRRFPTFLRAYTERGLAYETMGDTASARADYQAAVAMSPLFASGATMIESASEQNMARTRLELLSEAAPAPQSSTAVTPPGRATAVTAPDTPAPRNSAAVTAPAGAATVATADAPAHIALVIGNSAYRAASQLPNPVNDARGIAQNLRDIGFDVAEGFDLDHATMKKRVDDFLRRAVTARIALTFYAGHGVQIDGENYLLPVDVRPESGAQLKASTISLNTVLSGLDDRIRTTIVILDACRDNPLAPQAAAQGGVGRSLTLGPGLAQPSDPGHAAAPGAGTLLAFATAPGQVALDRDGVNSPFSTALIQHIGARGVEIQTVLTRVRADVVAATNGKQVPWSNSSLLGEVYLAK